MKKININNIRLIPGSGNFGFCVYGEPTKEIKEWAESWGINVAKLKHQIAHIEKLIFLNKENLGY